MTTYKMVDSDQLDADLTSVADKIREKGGTSAQLAFPAGFETAIDAISTGVELPELTSPGSASDLLSGKQLIDQDGEIVTGTIETVTQATPSISLSSSGLITASATQTEGYVSAGTQSATKQLSTQAAKTVTPGTSSQTAVASGRYTTGAVTVAGDANLVATNIKSGVSIFNVAGTMEAGAPNGKVWTQSNITTDKIYDVYYGNGIWVACSNDGNGIYYSYDGMTWTQSSITSGSYGSLCYGNGIWLAGSSEYDCLRYSTDGITWSSVTLNGVSASVYLLKYANGMFVAGASGSYGLYYSTNGTTWTEAISGSVNCFCYSDGVWVASVSSVIYYSTDGKTWTASTSMPDDPICIYGVDGFWIAGVLNFGYYYSTDCETWTQSNITSGAPIIIRKANGIWVAYELDSGMLYSTDGKTWYNSNVTYSANNIYNANGIWVLAGDDSTCYSSDGKIWTQSNLTSGGFISVRNANGIWVLGSSSGNGLYYSKSC